MNDSDKKLLCEAQDFVSSVASAVANIKVKTGFSRAVGALVHSRGKIVTTGLGKAGHAAQKTASSLCSLGFSACYLHPADASHGDIGIIEPEDVLMAFSTSGKTREVLETIKLARKLKVGCVIAITSHPNAPIREIADVEVDMGMVREAGHLGLAPTTSIIIMLVLADAMGTIAARMRGLTPEEFATRHHGGYLGKKARRKCCGR